MSTVIKIILGLAILFWLFSRGVQASDWGEPISPLLEQVNNYRESHGFPLLKTDTLLCRSARNRGIEMVLNGEFSHRGFRPEVDRHGLFPAFWLYGENLALDIEDKDIVTRWAASPTHDRNMLDSKFTHGCVERVSNVVVLWLGTK